MKRTLLLCVLALAFALACSPAEAMKLGKVRGEINSAKHRQALRGPSWDPVTLTIRAKVKGAERLRSYSGVGPRRYERRGKAFVSTVSVVYPISGRFCAPETFVLRKKKTKRKVKRSVCFR